MYTLLNANSPEVLAHQADQEWRLAQAGKKSTKDDLVYITNKDIVSETCPDCGAVFRPTYGQWAVNKHTHKMLCADCSNSLEMPPMNEEDWTRYSALPFARMGEDYVPAPVDNCDGWSIYDRIGGFWVADCVDQADAEEKAEKMNAYQGKIGLEKMLKK